MASTKVDFKLQGHEKFSLRDGWLNKGIRAVHEANEKYNVFTKDDATDILGIGNNMVKSLRYWMKAFGLIGTTPIEEKKLTPLGEEIFNNDIYLEKDFTLWLLQSQIAKNKKIATSWYLFFNKCDAVELSRYEIFRILKRELLEYSGGTKFSDNSLKNDIDVILNMYSRNMKVEDPEDKNVSPFVRLGIVKHTDSGFIKTQPDIRSLSEWNILYELSVLMEHRDHISIDEALKGDCGIINIYQINEVQANEYLDILEELGYIRLNRTAGLDMIYKSNKEDMKPETVIEKYYSSLI